MIISSSTIHRPPSITVSSHHNNIHPPTQKKEIIIAKTNTTTTPTTMSTPPAEHDDGGEHPVGQGDPLPRPRSTAPPPLPPRPVVQTASPVVAPSSKISDASPPPLPPRPIKGSSIVPKSPTTAAAVPPTDTTAPSAPSAPSTAPPADTTAPSAPPAPSIAPPTDTTAPSAPSAAPSAPSTPTPVPTSLNNIENPFLRTVIRFKDWVSSTGNGYGDYDVDSGLFAGTEDECLIRGRKSSWTLLISFIASSVMALVPLLTGDTRVMECDEETDECRQKGSNVFAYIVIAFGGYPWVFFLYFRTGLWMNTSGIAAKMSAFYGSDSVMYSGGAWESMWQLKYVVPTIDALSTMFVFVYTSIMLRMSICGCNQHIQRGVLAGTTLFTLVAYLSTTYCQTCPRKRMKILARWLFVDDVFRSSLVYTTAYGPAGCLFIIIPVVGYIEAFGFFEGFETKDIPGLGCCNA